MKVTLNDIKDMKDSAEMRIQQYAQDFGFSVKVRPQFMKDKVRFFCEFKRGNTVFRDTLTPIVPYSLADETLKGLIKVSCERIDLMLKDYEEFHAHL